MSKSVHNFEVRGVDKTSGAFASIKKRAATTSAELRAIVGSALAATSAYLGMGKLVKGINDLSHLSDIAQKTSTTTKELTGLSAALKVLGIQGVEVDNLGKSFDYMAKATGRTGLKGFYQTVEEIGKIEDVSKRGQEAVKVFGRSGMEFMPIINAAKDSTKALRSVVETMGGVSQAAANIGDDAADGVFIVKNKISNLWLEGIAAILKLVHGDIRGGAVAMGGYLEYGAKTAWRYLKAFFQNGEDGVERYKKVWDGLKDHIITRYATLMVVAKEYTKTLPERIVSGFAGGIFGIGGIFSKRFAAFHNGMMNDWRNEISTKMWTNIDKELKGLGIDAGRDFGRSIVDEVGDAFKDVSTDDLENRLEDILKKASEVTKNVNAAAKTTGERVNDLGLGFGLSKQSPRITNDLILGGSNAASRLQIIGPTLQSETKKQTELLSQLNDKVSKLIDNTDDLGSSEFIVTDL